MPEHPLHERLARECLIMTRYLSGSDPTAAVVHAYQRAQAQGVVGARPARFDRLLTSLAGRNPSLTRAFDSYATALTRTNMLRRKLILLLTILESSWPAASHSWCQSASAASSPTGSRPRANPLRQVVREPGLGVLPTGASRLAIQSFLASVERDPEKPIYLHHLGHAYLQNGSRPLARTTFEQALSLGANFEGPRKRAGRSNPCSSRDTSRRHLLPARRVCRRRRVGFPSGDAARLIWTIIWHS